MSGFVKVASLGDGAYTGSDGVLWCVIFLYYSFFLLLSSMITTQENGWGMVCIVVFVAFLVLLGAVSGVAAEDVVHSLQGDSAVSE